MASATVATPPSSLSYRWIQVATDATSQFEVKVSDKAQTEHRLLVLRHKAEPQQLLSVLDARCSHYGAPLVNGVMCGGRITCPWHAASFNCSSGNIEDMPALKPLNVYYAYADAGDSVYIAVDDQGRPIPKARQEECGVSKEGGPVVAVIGGGAAGFCAVQTLVEERQPSDHFRVVLICADTDLPFDRTKLSKNLEVKAQDIYLRPQQWYADNGVQVLTGTSVEGLNATSKSLKLSTGSDLHYDQVVIASGSKPRLLTTPGHDLGNVFTLRDIADAHAIVEQADKSKQVVIVGSGFIGLEVAAFLRRNTGVEKIVVVSVDEVPLARVLGDQIGRFVQTMHESNSVEFLLKQRLQAFKGNESGQVAAVVTESEEIVADMVLMGVGVSLNTEFLRSSGIELHGPEKSVVVSSHMELSVPGHFAAGDIAQFPFGVAKEPVRIEHWSVAQNQGRVAARNVLSNIRGLPFQAEMLSTPFFWTVQYGGSIRFVGRVSNPDEVLIDGNLEEEKKFVALYVKEGEVRAVCTFGRDPVAVAAGELLRLGRMPPLSDLRGEGGKAILSALAQEN